MTTPSDKKVALCNCGGKNLISPEEDDKEVMNMADLFYDDRIIVQAVPSVMAMLNARFGHECDNFSWHTSGKPSHEETSCAPIIGDIVMVPALAHIILYGNHKQMVQWAVAALHKMSHHSRGRREICESGSVSALLQKIVSPDIGVTIDANTAIHNLLLYQKGADTIIRQADGIPKFVLQLQLRGEPIFTHACISLTLLAKKGQENREAILESGGTAELIRTLNDDTVSYPMTAATSDVLRWLSMCPKNKSLLFEFRNLVTLIVRLSNPEWTHVVAYCLMTLRNLADLFDYFEHLGWIMERISGVFDMQNDRMRACAADILRIMTKRNLRIRKAYSQANSVPVLINAINTANGCHDIIEPAVQTLCHLTSRHTKAMYAQDSICVLDNGCSTIVKLLDEPSRWPLIIQAIRLTRNLAYCVENRMTLRDENAIDRLIRLFAKVKQDYVSI